MKIGWKCELKKFQQKRPNKKEALLILKNPILIIDSAKCHLTDTAEDAAGAYSKLAVILDGLTKVL